MSTLVGKKAPNFKTKAASTTQFEDIELSQYLGHYVLLFFYPLDFTFVCPTELLAFQDRLEEFRKLNTVLLGCSVDSHFTHRAWLNTPVEQGGIKGVEYSLLSDISGKIADSYGILNDEGVAYRAWFLINKEGTVCHTLVNSLPLGRNVDEAIRVIEALKYFEQEGEVCPANWNKGQSTFKPTHEGVSQYLGRKYNS
jgi:peroxiredoxin 2/4